MDVQVRRQIERIHDSNAMCVLAVAGGGIHALDWLLTVPGASRTVLEVIVPYAASSLTDFVGYKPQKIVSSETSRDMAYSAYKRAESLGPRNRTLIGVGCTAALTTKSPKRGGHRCFITTWTKHFVSSYELILHKGMRDRTGEDEIVSRLVLRSLAETSEVYDEIPLTLTSKESLSVSSGEHVDFLKQVLHGSVNSVSIRPDGRMIADRQVEGGVLPGAFDPIHRGHIRLAEVAQNLLKSSIAFELSVFNVDKCPLSRDEVQRRVNQFTTKGTVVVTRAATFREKARIFPSCTFVIGWDTAARLIAPRYYQGSYKEMLRSFQEIRDLECRFLVAGRVDEGEFQGLNKLLVPEEVRDLFTEIPETAFRCDLSSTELRVASRKT